MFSFHLFFFYNFQLYKNFKNIFCRGFLYVFLRFLKRRYFYQVFFFFFYQIFLMISTTTFPRHLGQKPRPCLVYSSQPGRRVSQEASEARRRSREHSSTHHRQRKGRALVTSAWALRETSVSCLFLRAPSERDEIGVLYFSEVAFLASTDCEERQRGYFFEYIVLTSTAERDGIGTFSRLLVLFTSTD